MIKFVFAVAYGFYYYFFMSSNRSLCFNLNVIHDLVIDSIIVSCTDFCLCSFFVSPLNFQKEI